MNRNATAIILIVLAIGIYFTVTRSAWADALTAKAENDQYSGAIEKAKELIAIRDDLREAYKNISVDNQLKLDKMIPNTVDNIRLIIDLNNVAKESLGLTLKNVKASTNSASASSPSAVSAPASALGVTPLPTLDTVKISFSVSAQYAQFIALMQYLEANLRIMDVTHLAVTANDTGTYDFSVELVTYWLRQ